MSDSENKIRFIARKSLRWFEETGDHYLLSFRAPFWIWDLYHRLQSRFPDSDYTADLLVKILKIIAFSPGECSAENIATFLLNEKNSQMVSKWLKKNDPNSLIWVEAVRKKMLTESSDEFSEDAALRYHRYLTAVKYVLSVLHCLEKFISRSPVKDGLCTN